jgi:hypothetical protein
MGHTGSEPGRRRTEAGTERCSFGKREQPVCVNGVHEALAVRAVTVHIQAFVINDESPWLQLNLMCSSAEILIDERQMLAVLNGLSHGIHRVTVCSGRAVNPPIRHKRPTLVANGVLRAGKPSDVVPQHIVQGAANASVVYRVQQSACGGESPNLCQRALLSIGSNPLEDFCPSRPRLRASQR